MKLILPFVLLTLLFLQSCKTEPKTIWQIAKADNGSAEFALASGDFKFPASKLLNDGKIELEMGPVPNEHWGISNNPNKWKDKERHVKLTQRIFYFCPQSF